MRRTYSNPYSGFVAQRETLSQAMPKEERRFGPNALEMNK
jgi:hypothetical protein